MNLKPDTLNLICAIARDAGSSIMKIYGEDDFCVEYKSDESPLTAADKAAHEVIVAGLQQHFPDIPILSEEGGDIPYAERKTWHRFWLVDPLDGTKEFIKRNGEFTVNIALIEGNAPALGVVYVPAQDKLYCGVVGEGAWMIEPKVQGTRYKESGCNLEPDTWNLEPESTNLEPGTWNLKPESTNLEPETWDLSPLRVRTIEPEHGVTVVMSRSHPSPELEEYLKDINVAEALPVGSSLKLCVVAEGKADLYPRLGPTMEWDTAAGHAVVLAAGGTVKTPEGQELLYNKENLLNPYFIVEGTRG